MKQGTKERGIEQSGTEDVEAPSKMLEVIMRRDDSWKIPGGGGDRQYLLLPRREAGYAAT